MDNQHSPVRVRPAHLASILVVLTVVAAWGLGRTRHASPGEAPTLATVTAQTPEQYRRQLEAMMRSQTQGPDAAQMQRMQRMQQAMQQAMQQLGGAQPVPAAATPPKVEIVKETATSVELVVSLPDGETASGGIKFEPNRAYTPTPAELEAHPGSVAVSSGRTLSTAPPPAASLS